MLRITVKDTRTTCYQFERTAIPQITVEQVKGNIVLIPPLTEQRSISEKVINLQLEIMS